MSIFQDLKNNEKAKKIFGIILIIIGFIALVTPFTPGSWLVFVGLELIGFRTSFYDQLKAWWKRDKK